MKRFLHPVRPQIAVLLAAAAPLVLGGCLFEPRDVEEPTGEEVSYLPRIAPENVVANAETALNNLDAPGWSEAIGEEFLYLPDSQTLSEFPQVFATEWDREREMVFIGNLFNRVSQIRMTMRDEDLEIPEPAGGEADWRFIYEMTIIDTAGVETTVRGSCEIKLRLQGSFWVIEEWIDEQGETDDTGTLRATMGSVRGTFASK